MIGHDSPDEWDYLAHATAIASLSFDYSREFGFNPVNHAVGPGLIASPVVFLFSLIDLALSRLAQIDDAVVLRDESVDASNLVGGTMVGWYWLIRELADAREVDSLEIISDLRSFLDE